MRIFEPAVLGKPRHSGGRVAPVSWSPAGARPLQLGDLATVEPDSPAAGASAADPQQAPEPPAQILFDEAELARACAAAASLAASAADRAAMERAVAADASLRAKLEVAVSGLRAELADRQAAFREVLGRLVALALGALIPRLRDLRLAAAVERILRSAPGQPRQAPLVLEVPSGAHDELAARVPTLLAEAGLEGPFEVRSHDAGDGLVRLTCGDLWSEFDAAAWAAAVTERVVAVLSEPVAASHRNDGD